MVSAEAILPRHFNRGNNTKTFQPRQYYLGQAVSTLHHPLAQPSLLCTVPGPSHLHFTKSLSQAISTLHSPWAEPSPLDTIPRPSRLHFIPNPWAEPSPLYIIPRPSRLLFTQSLGPVISTLPIPWAELSPLYTIPWPSRLHFIQSLGEAVVGSPPWLCRYFPFLWTFTYSLYFTLSLHVLA